MNFPKICEMDGSFYVHMTHLVNKNIFLYV